MAAHLKPEESAIWHLWGLSSHDPAAADTMVAMYKPFIASVAKPIRDADPTVTARAATDAAGVITATLEGISIFLGRGEPAGNHRQLQRAALEAALATARRAGAR